MDVKKTLEELIEKDGLDNVSLNENSFTVYFGDVLNTETATGNQYYLLGTYIEIPYSLNTIMVKLHREIVNEFETGGERENYEYSGFVHYSGSYFCWGGCRIDSILSEAVLDDDFTEDTFYKIVLYFDKFLSTSSHDSGTRTTAYKKLDLGETTEVKNYLSKTKTVNDIVLPFEITQVIKKSVTDSINYDVPYKRVIKEFPDKKFEYKGEWIIPKVVEHYKKSSIVTEIKKRYINVSEILRDIEKTKQQLYRDEINNKPRITIENLLHKLPNTQRRVDGGFYIQD